MLIVKKKSSPLNKRILKTTVARNVVDSLSDVKYKISYLTSIHCIELNELFKKL